MGVLYAQEAGALVEDAPVEEEHDGHHPDAEDDDDDADLLRTEHVGVVVVGRRDEAERH